MEGAGELNLETLTKKLQGLEALVVELRRRGVEAEPRLVESLRLARSLLKVCEAIPGCSEALLKARALLEEVEVGLYAKAEEALGEGFIEEWLSSAKPSPSAPTPISFTPGLPRRGGWVRLKATGDEFLRVVKELASAYALTYVEEGGYVTITGSDEGVRGFVKSLASKVKEGLSLG